MVVFLLFSILATGCDAAEFMPQENECDDASVMKKSDFSTFVSGKLITWCPIVT